MVYITSDLFGPAESHNRYHSAYTGHCTTMANPQHAAGLGKRKRFAEDEVNERTFSHVQSSHSVSTHSTGSSLNPARPTGWTFAQSQPHNTSHLQCSSDLSHALFSTKATQSRPSKQLKRTSPKSALVKSTSHLMDVETERKPLSVSNLGACHACNLAPKRKKDLENYLDCRRCEGRTCYICARQCVGACGNAVCKKCIVEVGEEGDPWCLDCYAQNINSQ